MTDEAFEKAVLDGIEQLPKWVKDELANVIFLIKETPTTEQLLEQKMGTDETLFGLYEGVPLSERGNDSVFLPDTITIFKQPILEMYEREVDIRECIANTIWHEVAHYFGHGEEWVMEEEVRRGKVK